MLQRVLLAFLLFAVISFCLWGSAHGGPTSCSESLRTSAEPLPAITCQDPSGRMQANFKSHEMEFLFIHPDIIVASPLERVFVAPSTVLAHEIRFLFVPVGCHAPPPA